MITIERKNEDPRRINSVVFKVVFLGTALWRSRRSEVICQRLGLRQDYEDALWGGGVLPLCGSKERWSEGGKASSQQG